MKIFIFLLVIILNVYNTIADVQSTNDKIKNISRIINLLNDNATTNEKIEGFSKAEKIDCDTINSKLVFLLDSMQEGGKDVDILLLPSWHAALIILVRRFPESGINKNPLAYERDDAEMFKRWWSENCNRIEYHDNTHTLVSKTASDTNHKQPSATFPLPEVTKESTPTPTPAAAETAAAVSIHPPPLIAAPTPLPPVVESKSSSGFPIVAVAVVGAVIVGIVVFLLHSKST